MYECSFLKHYNSTKNLINLFGENYEQKKAETFKLLKIKYFLIIINKNHLEKKMTEY